MSTEVESGDWLCLDDWWAVYREGQPVARNSASAGVLDKEGLTNSWNELDPWWQAHIEASSVAQRTSMVRNLETEELTATWDELSPWWETYTETGHSTAVAIADLLEQSNEKWRKSEGPFDTDPLAADLTLDYLSRGPFQPTNEVEWSRWLAQLLQPSPELIDELFGLEVAQPPQKVVRENQLSKTDEQDGTFRRPDILVFHTDRGISIEVKLGDENYQKTAETARLVEHHYGDYDWTHTLLLPKRKNQRLDSIVEPSITSPSDGPSLIEWDDPAPVAIINWCDVTAAIRSLLCRDAIVDDHWAANAYLFCAVAEQQLMGFKPKPVIERLATPTSAVDAIQPIQIASDLEEQLTYLQTRRSL